MALSDDAQQDRQATADEAGLHDCTAADDGYDGEPDSPLVIPPPLRLALAGLWAAGWVLGGLMLAMFLLAESGTFDASFNTDADGTSGWFLLLALVLTPLLIGIAGALPARLLGGSWLRGALAMNGAGIVAALVARSLPGDGLRVSAIIVLWMVCFLLMVMAQAQVGTYRTAQLVAVLALALVLLVVVSVVPRTTPVLLSAGAITWMLLPVATRSGSIPELPEG